MKIRFILAMFTLVLIAVCCRNGNRKKDAVVLSSKKMQLVMWDMLQADAFVQGFLLKDSAKKNLSVESAALQQKIFQLHNISREDFTKSYDYYSSNPAEMRAILDSISSRGEREKNDVIKERYSGVKEAAKSVD